MKANGLSNTIDYWVGISDKANEGKWKYMDGPAVKGLKWGLSEPQNHGGNEDCGGLLGGPNKLADWNCGHKGNYALCQVPNRGMQIDRLCFVIAVTVLLLKLTN